MAPELRAEVGRTIEDSQLTALERTAGARLEMVQIWKDLAPARTCLEQEHLRLNWWGMSEHSLLPLGDSQNPESDCPTASPDQLGRLIEITESLATESELLPALDHLVAWAALTVTVHEARHLADRKRDGPQGPPCHGCQSELSVTERSELSAYLSTLAHPALASTARLQACDALAVLPESSPHARALSEIQAQSLDGMCTDSIPDFLSRTKVAMAGLLGRAPSSELPTDFPRRLPVALQPPSFEP